MIVHAKNQPFLRAAPQRPGEVPGPLAETCQSLLAKLRFAQGSPVAPQTVGVTGCEAGVGSTTVAMNLALVAASWSGIRTALVEAAVDRPVAVRDFGLPRGPGYFDVLREQAELDDALHRIGGLDLWVAPAGLANLGAATAPQFSVSADIDSELKKRFDLIVFDLPNAARPAFLLPLACQLDGVVLVVEAERTPLEAALRAKELLQQSRCRVLGCVLNKRRDRVPAWLDRAL